MSLVWSGLLRGLAWLPLVFLEWLVRRRLQRGGVVRLKFDRRLMRDEGPESIVHLAADLHGMAEDPNVLAVWIELHQLPPGWSSVQEIREALAAIRSNGKLVVVCLQNLTNGGLLLASVADRVWMVPSGEVLLSPLTARLVFYGDLLARFGLKVDLEAVGDFKSFGESYTRSWSTTSNREQVSALLGDLSAQLETAICEGRGIEVDSLRTLIHESPASPERAVEAGLVDELAYPDQLTEALERRLGCEIKPMAFVAYRRLRRWTKGLSKWGIGENCLGVVHLNGPVMMGDTSTRVRGPVIKAERVVEAIDELAAQESVKGVVLHVNSPGGSALASDLIARSVRKMGEKKPVVAVFGDVAASGGYYLSAPAVEVVARAGTITGSIGVVGGKLVLGDGAGRWGVHSETLPVGESGSLFDGWSAFDPAQRKRFKASLQRVYDQFLAIVAAGRRMPVAAVAEVAKGRVWTGRQAIAQGLVDHDGGLRTGLDRVAALAGVQVRDCRVLELSFSEGRLRAIAKLFRGAIGGAVDDGKDGAMWSWATEMLTADERLRLTMLHAHPGEGLTMLPWEIRL